MISVRPIAFVIGLMLTTLGIAMLLPALMDVAVGNADWAVFATSSAVTLFFGVGLVFSARGEREQISIRTAFLLTVLLWLVLTAFAALPFLWCEFRLSLTDAFFEAMSGLTTTGSTVLVGLDHAPPGLLLWRGLLQWLGGLGIIVMAIAVFPMLQIGGMQLFKVEAFETGEKLLPKATQISATLIVIYVLATMACAVSYQLAGMNVFDSMVHAMTTVATGGFANYDASLAHFASPNIEFIAVAFMIIGSLPFMLFIKSVQGQYLALWRDQQVRWFLCAVLMIWGLAVVAIIVGGQAEMNGWPDLLREALFNSVSVMTGTGYTTTAYDRWGAMAMVLFFLMAFVGGCAGSTSCGIKIFRFQILYLNMRQTARRSLYPNGVFVNRYNGAPVNDQVSASVLNFFILFFCSFGVLVAILTGLGLDPITAWSAAGTAIANVGPGLGPIVGPVGNFSSLPDAAKWALAAGMLLGRLEIFSILVLLTPAFWRD